MNDDLQVVHPHSASSSTWFLVELEFEKCWFLRRGEKASRSKGENQRQTQPTYGVDAGIWTRATLVGGECSHHCATLSTHRKERSRPSLFACFFCSTLLNISSSRSIWFRLVSVLSGVWNGHRKSVWISMITGITTAPPIKVVVPHTHVSEPFELVPTSLSPV